MSEPLAQSLVDAKPWELMRRAADHLEKLAAEADPGPWRDVQKGWCVRSEPSPDRATWRTVASEVEHRNIGWVTAMSPAVAKPLVEWMRTAAWYMNIETRQCSSPDGMAKFMARKYGGAIDLATAILDEISGDYRAESETEEVSP